MNSTQPIHVGICGFGTSGQAFHAPLIAATPGFTISSVSTNNPDNIAAAKEKYPQATIVGGIDELCADESLQLIVLAIPNQLHYEFCSKVLQAGKHVVVEKPFTVTSAEGQELIDLAKEKNRILAVYHNRRWDSDFLTVKKIIAEEKLGRLVEYEARFDRFRNYIKPNAWKEEGAYGSDIVFDLGSHLIDQALVLFGPPEKVFADLRIQRKNSKVIDKFEILLYYPELKVSLKAGMLHKELPPHFSLFGDAGAFVKFGMDVQEDSLRNGKRPDKDQPWGVEPENQYGLLNTCVDGKEVITNIPSEAGNYGEFYRNLREAIHGSEKLAIRPEEALMVIKVIELAHQSAKEERLCVWKG